MAKAQTVNLAPNEQMFGATRAWEYKGPISFTPDNFPKWLMEKATFKAGTDDVSIEGKNCQAGNFVILNADQTIAIMSAEDFNKKYS